MKLGRAHKIADVLRCLHCGHNVNGASMIGGSGAPEPGAFCICVLCMGVNVVTAARDFRLPTPAESAEADAAPQVRFARETIQAGVLFDRRTGKRRRPS